MVVSKTFSPNSVSPFALSRTKLELFVSCPRCFYLDRRLGIGRPSGPPFTLNSAVDKLLKKEFDIYRVAGKAHPLMTAYGIDAVPIPHKKLDSWRHNFTGVRYVHEPTNLEIYGAIDDLWQNKEGEYIVVDYKATAKEKEITELEDTRWHNSYKRQMEIYQWLLRQNGLNVSDTGYFIYCNGKADRKAFDKSLEFDISVIPYKGDDSWVEGVIFVAHKCLVSDKVPEAEEKCEYCQYVKEAGRVREFLIR